MPFEPYLLRPNACTVPADGLAGDCFSERGWAFIVPA
jgi:hypothetical protein